MVSQVGKKRQGLLLYVGEVQADHEARRCVALDHAQDLDNVYLAISFRDKFNHRLDTRENL
jgi:hypothetical protein